MKTLEAALKAAELLMVDLQSARDPEINMLQDRGERKIAESIIYLQSSLEALRIAVREKTETLAVEMSEEFFQAGGCDTGIGPELLTNIIRRQLKERK